MRDLGHAAGDCQDFTGIHTRLREANSSQLEESLQDHGFVVLLVSGAID
jgi:hypothetical protein